MNKKYIAIIALDFFWMALAYAWLFHGIEGAGNVFIFMMWFSGVLACITGWVADKTSFKTKRPKYFYPWHALTDFAIVSICAWSGHFLLAAVYAFGHFAQEAAREREPKSPAKDSQAEGV